MNWDTAEMENAETVLVLELSLIIQLQVLITFY